MRSGTTNLHETTQKKSIDLPSSILFRSISRTLVSSGGFLFLLLLAVVAMSPAYAGGSDKADDSTEIAVQFAPIIVNGRKLSGPSSRARRRSGRLMIPVSVVARALGDTINVDATARSVSVQRQNGVIADFDARLGGVRESGLPILVVSNGAEIIFSPSADELFLPTEITAALFDVSIRYDADKNEVLITRGVTRTEPFVKLSGQSFAEIHQIDYEYGLNRYSSVTSQNLNLAAAGRLADGRFHFSTNSDRAAGRGISLRNTTFNFERPNGQRFTGGDFGAGSNLQFLSANVRGGSASIPVGDTIITAFGGRSFSGIYAPVLEFPLPREPQAAVRSRFRYDTNIFGFYATTLNPLSPRKASPLTFSAGAMRFSGSRRSGDLVSGSINYDSARFSLQSDFGIGKFSGLRADGSRFSASGAAADVAATFNVTDNLTFHGRYAYIGQNFLSAQQGFREPTDLKSAGARWSPVKWLTTSIHASIVKRPGDTTQNNSYVTAAFGIAPRAGLPTLFVSHTESRTSQAGPSSFTLVNASKEFRRLRLFLNATRIKTLGPASINANVSASFAVNDRHSLEFSQGIGGRKSYNGQFDWRTSNLLSQRVSLSAGLGYSSGQNSKLSLYERLSASVNLPRQTSLQVNYYHTNAGSTLLFSLKGLLFRKREARAFLDSPTSTMNSYGKILGRVYQDIDLDGRFDAGIDKPQADVKVRVDGNRVVISDANGLYRVDAVMEGQHQVYIDLLSVRADLTMLDAAAQNTKLLAGRDSVVDFRLVRTGRISGIVWLDLNENGKIDENEQHLENIRIVVGSGHDTLTDSNGFFAIGDLPPGEQVILIDEKTLPEKTRSSFATLSVKVFAGRETTETNFAVTTIPAEIKHFGSK